MVGLSKATQVVTNWSSRAYSRTMSRCHAMNSVVHSFWNVRQARSYCGWALPSGRHSSTQWLMRCDQ